MLNAITMNKNSGNVARRVTKVAAIYKIMKVALKNVLPDVTAQTAQSWTKIKNVFHFLYVLATAMESFTHLELKFGPTGAQHGTNLQILKILFWD